MEEAPVKRAIGRSDTGEGMPMPCDAARVHGPVRVLDGEGVATVMSHVHFEIN